VITEGRIDILEEMWNNVNGRSVDAYAARGGKLNVLKWYETKGLSINIAFCAQKAAYGGQTHIIQWLREEKGYQLKRECHDSNVLSFLVCKRHCFYESSFCFTLVVCTRY